MGQVNGLAWTSVGGELLQIEAAVTAGKGRVIKDWFAWRCDARVNSSSTYCC